MKDKKCRITIELQAEEEGVLKFSARYLCQAVSRVTGMADVTATVEIPDKFDPTES